MVKMRFKESTYNGYPEHVYVVSHSVQCWAYYVHRPQNLCEKQQVTRVNLNIIKVHIFLSLQLQLI